MLASLQGMVLIPRREGQMSMFVGYLLKGSMIIENLRFKSALWKASILAARTLEMPLASPQERGYTP